MSLESDVEQKLKLLQEHLAEGLFGHVVITSAFWGQLEDYLSRWFPLFAKLKVENRVVEGMEWVLLNHPLHRFPVASPHLVSVINWLKHSLLLNAPDMRLSEHVSHLLAKHQGAVEPIFIYKSLNRNPSFDATVTLFEENEIIGHGTTGYTSWQGALFATDWLLSNFSSSFKDSRIMELGCGVGFLGLHLLKSIPMKSLILTDCHPEVLKAVRYNVMLNFGTPHLLEDMTEHATHGPPKGEQNLPWEHKLSENCTVVVDELDWTRKESSQIEVDWILGADIVYERTLIPPLCHVLQRVLQCNPTATALISCTERSSTTLACFEKELRQKGLKFGILSRGSFTPAESLLCSDVSHQKTRIYEITLER